MSVLLVLGRGVQCVLKTGFQICEAVLLSAARDRVKQEEASRNHLERTPCPLKGIHTLGVNQTLEIIQLTSFFSVKQTLAERPLLPKISCTLDDETSANVDIRIGDSNGSDL